MARPEASPAAEELYEGLSPAFTNGDESRDWVALKLCIALTAGNLDLIHSLVTEDIAPDWQVLLDPANAPEDTLPYLAQFDGARLRPDMDTAQRRAAITEPEAFGRGTLEQLEKVAKRRLTGTQSVIVTERYTGSAWRLRVETVEAETPEPERTEQEIIEEAKPIGIVLFFNARVPWTWEELLKEKETYPTWESIKAAFATWEDFRLHEP